MRLGEFLSQSDKLALFRAVGKGLKRKSLKALVDLYDQMGNEKMAAQTRQKLEQL